MVPTDTRNLSSPCITSHADREDILPLAFSLRVSKGTVVQSCSRAMASTFAGSSIAARQVLSANSAADFESARAGAAWVEAKAAARAKINKLRMTNYPWENCREGHTCVHWAIVPGTSIRFNYNTPIGRARAGQVGA